MQSTLALSAAPLFSFIRKMKIMKIMNENNFIIFIHYFENNESPNKLGAADIILKISAAPNQ